MFHRKNTDFKLFVPKSKGNGWELLAVDSAITVNCQLSTVNCYKCLC
ncbi:MAG: hypothetical protein JGK29_26435 [Microcoleus sp. PH2017_17_BER_D_A]|nr:hypothetical protein [Microcoleus sp. PH2017_17_BER_D_A]